MNAKKSLDHILIGITFAILGSLLGLLIVELYFLAKGYKPGTAWEFLNLDLMRTNMLILSQVPNVFVFFTFFQTKRDKSAYGVMFFILLIGIIYAATAWL